MIYINELGWSDNNCKLFILGYAFIFLVFISVIDLFIFHVMIVTKGITTVENKDVSKLDNKYNLKQNIESMLGEGIISWFFPTSNLYFNYRTKN